jgi:hypothetical protein
VSVACWDGHGPILADTSAWTVARNVASAHEMLLAAAERGDIAWCWPVRYELTIDARSVEDIGRVDRTFEGMREVAAQKSGLAVLHHDSHFDQLAPLLGIQSYWIADPVGPQ